VKAAKVKAAAAAPEPIAIARPFLKWAGGKRQLAPELLARMPAKFGTYYEPFVGGGALFFALVPQLRAGRAVLSDMNTDLTVSYIGVRDDVEGVIACLKEMPYDREFYLETRGKSAQSRNHMDDAERAAWVIYTNKAGFNGLYRVNRKGEFNVPFGRYDNPTICDEPNLRAASAALKLAHIRIGDFERALRGAEEGDAVYCDPPYVPVSATADFTGYTSGGFGPADQTRLRDCALALKRRGVFVMLSNADVPAVRKLYRGFKIERVEARRAINSKADRRGAVGEVIIT